MKAADISDEAFLAAVDHVNAATGLPAMVWQVQLVLAGWMSGWHPDVPGVVNLYHSGHELTEAARAAIPTKVLLAKAKRLIRRSVLDGCHCGCRGDFQRPAAAQPEPKQRLSLGTPRPTEVLAMHLGITEHEVTQALQQVDSAYRVYADGPCGCRALPWTPHRHRYVIDTTTRPC